MVQVRIFVGVVGVRVMTDRVLVIPMERVGDGPDTAGEHGVHDRLGRDLKVGGIMPDARDVPRAENVQGKRAPAAEVIAAAEGGP